jgi:hypothetical protein
MTASSQIREGLDIYAITVDVFIFILKLLFLGEA